MLILDDPHGRPVHTLAFSPDGRTLASVSGRSPVVAFWDLQTRQKGYTLGGETGRVVSIAFSPSGECFASVTFTGSLFVWRTNERPGIDQPPWSFGLQHAVTRDPARHAPCQLVFSPDGKHLATMLGEEPPAIPTWRWRATAPAQISFIDLRTHKVRLFDTRHQGEVSCLAYSPDGTRLATGSFDRTIRLHSLKFRTTLSLSQGTKVHFLAFAPDGRTLAAGSPAGMVRLWDAEGGNLRRTFHVQPGPLHALCYSPDGRTLLTASGETQGTVRIWDVSAGTSRVGFDWDVGTLHSVAFAPDGMRAAAGGVGRIVVWDIDDQDL